MSNVGFDDVSLTISLKSMSDFGFPEFHDEEDEKDIHNFDMVCETNLKGL